MRPFRNLQQILYTYLCIIYVWKQGPWGLCAEVWVNTMIEEVGAVTDSVVISDTRDEVCLKTRQWSGSSVLNFLSLAKCIIDEGERIARSIDLVPPVQVRSRFILALQYR